MLSTHIARVLPVLVLPLVLVGCSGSSDSGSAAPAPASTAGSSPAASADSTAGPTSTGAPTASAGGGQTANDGCVKNGQAIPKGAGKASSPDLDHDGKRDSVWLADSGSTRRLGVRTASGDTFSTAAPQPATAIGQRLGDGSAIILLNTGRSVQLYAVVGCQIVPTKNVQGKQYSFDLGFTGYGTGVKCVDAGRGLQVAGMLADPGTTQKYTVYQTRAARPATSRARHWPPRRRPAAVW
jgi:hypothetical protein